MADYTLSAKGTYDGSNFDSGIDGSKSKLESFIEKADQVGSRIRSAIGDGFVRAADTVTSGIGTIGAAVTGLAAVGGINRALNIEQAQYKIKQMGLDVEAVMASCNEAVRGTAYGLDAAATVASSLGASGVQAGDQMTQALKGVAGMAAMSGRSMEDVGLIFGKVAATGKLQGDELNQMAEAGVNATAALAKHLGKTQAEVREMVSKGQIDFQTFSDAMYATFGTAASGANETFGGAMSNVRAALSRVGEQFASPALDALRQVFVALMPVIDATAAALRPVAEEFGKFLEGVVPKLTSALDGAKTAIDGLGEGGFTNLPAGVKLAAAAVAMFSIGSLGGLISRIPIVGDALGGLFGSLGGLATPFSTLQGLASGAMGAMSGFKGAVAAAGGGVTGLKAVLMGLATPMNIAMVAAAALTAAFVYLMATNEGFRSSMGKVASQLGSALAPVLQQIGTVLLPAIGSVLAAFLPTMQTVIEVIGQLLAAIAPIVATIAGTVIPMVSQALTLVAQVVEQVLGAVLPVVQQLADMISAYMPLIQQVVTLVLGAIQAAFQAVWPLVQSIVESALTAIKGVVDAVLPVIQAFIETTLGVIQGVIAAVMAVIEGDWSGAWEAVKGIAETVWNGIGNIINAALSAIDGAIGSVLGAIKSIWESVWSSVGDFLNACWNGIVSAVTGGSSDVMAVLGDLPGKIIGLFAGAGSWLIDAGSSILHGLISGFQSALNWASGKISEGLSWLRGLFPFSPAKRGPFSGHGWVLYSGMSVMDAMGEGAQMEAAKTIKTYAGIAGKMRDALDISPNIGQVDYGRHASIDYGTAARQVKGGTENHYDKSNNVTLNVTVEGAGRDSTEIAQDLYSLVKRSERGYRR